MNELIIHDIYNLIFSISIKYNIDLDTLTQRYIPIINIEKKIYKIKRIFNQRKPNVTITHPQLKCTARTWANGHVHFDTILHKWIYGTQCTKLKYATKHYCPQHLHLIRKHGSLLHGDFFTHPTHNHYDKFKIKI
jgi:hypothetical protein